MAYLDDVITQENFDTQVSVVGAERSQRMDNVPYGTAFEEPAAAGLRRRPPVRPPADRQHGAPRGGDARRGERLPRRATTCRTTRCSRSSATSPRRTAFATCRALPRRHHARRRAQARAARSRCRRVTSPARLDLTEDVPAPAVWFAGRLPADVAGLARAGRRRDRGRASSARARPADCTAGWSARTRSRCPPASGSTRWSPATLSASASVRAVPGPRPRRRSSTVVEEVIGRFAADGPYRARAHHRPGPGRARAGSTRWAPPAVAPTRCPAVRLLYDDPEALNERLPLLRSLTAEEVRAAAEQWLLAPARRPASDPPVEERPRGRNDRRGGRRDVRRRRCCRRRLALPRGAASRTCRNGIRLLAYHCPGQYVVSTTLLFDLPAERGAARPRGRRRAGRRDVWREGAGGLSADDFSDALAPAGAELDASASPDGFSVRLSVPVVAARPRAGPDGRWRSPSRRTRRRSSSRRSGCGCRRSSTRRPTRGSVTVEPLQRGAVRRRPRGPPVRRLDRRASKRCRATTWPRSPTSHLHPGSATLVMAGDFARIGSRGAGRAVARAAGRRRAGSGGRARGQPGEPPTRACCSSTGRTRRRRPCGWPGRESPAATGAGRRCSSPTTSSAAASGRGSTPCCVSRRD